MTRPKPTPLRQLATIDNDIVRCVLLGFFIPVHFFCRMLDALTTRPALLVSPRFYSVSLLLYGAVLNGALVGHGT